MITMGGIKRTTIWAVGAMPASQRLYKAMASTIQDEYAHAPYLADRRVIIALVTRLCGDLKQDNMRFNREKFLEVCFLTDRKVNI